MQEDNNFEAALDATSDPVAVALTPDLPRPNVVIVGAGSPRPEGAETAPLQKAIGTETSPNGPEATGPGDGQDARGPGGPRVPRRIEWVDVEPAEYPEFKARVWVNFPQKLSLEINSGDNERASVAMRAIVLEHNGWLDEDGEPYPAAGEAGFWDAIPLRLAVLTIARVRAVTTELPNSLAPTVRR